MLLIERIQGPKACDGWRTALEWGIADTIGGDPEQHRDMKWLAETKQFVFIIGKIGGKEDFVRMRRGTNPAVGEQSFRGLGNHVSVENLVYLLADQIDHRHRPTMACRECAATQLVHDDVGSLVCTRCGTLADPAQAVLADHNDYPTTSSYSAPRTREGWHLAQTKQDRDRKNMVGRHVPSSSLLTRPSDRYEYLH